MNRRKLVPIAIVVVLVLLAAVWWTRRGGPPASHLEASGTVEATEAHLGFQTGGRIAAIDVEEGARVNRGETLARLDAEEIEARKAQAEARVAAARAQLAELEGGFRPEEIGQAEASVQAAAGRLEDARRDLARTRALEAGGAVSPEALQKAITAADLAEAELRRTREQLALLRRGPRVERIDAARAQLEEASAASRAVDAALANAALVSPHSGIVTVRHREPNEIVAPGQPVVTVMNPADRWVRIYVPENRIGAVRLGDPAVIRSDTWPDRRYAGRVTHVSPEAEFTPKSVQTAEERVRLVYAVKVRIDGDEELELKPGMPADVELRPVRDGATEG